MKILIKEIDIRKKNNLIIEFLKRNLTPHIDDKRFNWLYLSNPHGIARAWAAYEEKSDMLIGISAAFPRIMQVYGEDVECWNLGDFAISKDSRSLGPAIGLQRACLAPIMNGEISFSYDHPSCSMMAVYKRLKLDKSCRVYRFTKLLRIDHKVSEIFKEGIVARGVGAIGSSLLKFKDHLVFKTNKYEVNCLEGKFGDEFTQLDGEVSDQYKVSGRRTSTYLNWRYLDNPQGKFEVATIRNKGKLLAYAIFSLNNKEAFIVDLFGRKETGVIDSLLRNITEMLRRRNVNSISISLLEFSPLISILNKIGYYRREYSNFVVCAKQGSKIEQAVTNVDNWHLTFGDRDI